MTNYAITKDYDENLRKLETTDSVHADTLNPMMDKLINNDAFLNEEVKKNAELLADRVKKGDNYVNALDHGVKPDGSTLTTQALKAAVAFAETVKRNLRMPSGDYLLNDTITVTCIDILGDGIGRTRLIFDNPAGKDGIFLNPIASEMSLGVYDMSILCKGSNGGSAVKTQDNSQIYYTYHTKYQFERLLFAGYTLHATPLSVETVEAWTVGLDIGDSSGCGVREIYGMGNFRIDQDPSTQFQSTFIKAQANGAVLGVHGDSLFCAAMYRAVDVGDKSFFQIQKFDFSHCYDGVFQSASTTTAYDESKLLDGNINAQRYGVYFFDIGSRQIDGVIVRRHRKGWKGATHDWIGFYLKDSSLSWINSCHAQPDENEGAFNGTQIGICSLRNSLISINGFVAGSTLDEGIRYDDNTGMTTSNTISAQNQSTAKLFNLVNNTRASSFGIYSLVSSFAGTVYAKDGTIGTSNKVVSTATL